MARYINENDVYGLLGERGMATVHCTQIDDLPRADVAPRAEVAREIFEEIEKTLVFGADRMRVAALKKKYTDATDTNVGHK